MNDGLKQVAVQLDPEAAPLQFHQILHNRQPQARTFGMPGGIPPDKPFHNLVGCKIQLEAGHIFDDNSHPAVLVMHLNIGPGIRRGILDDVGKQVFKNPVRLLAVQWNNRLILRLLEPELDAGIRNTVA
ncbi:hypothetical protein D3C75_690560 [compost metagenome]